jgi:transposase-like protein
MTHCPRCGHTILVAQSGVATRVAQRIACPECAHVWAVATVDPISLAEVDDEEQRAETD